MAIRLTKNFLLSEFKCHNGEPVPLKYRKHVQLLADNLQVLRDEAGVPVTIISGYRPSKYNKSVGGAKRSKHKKAMAGDIRIEGWSTKRIWNTIKRLIKEKKMKQGGLGIYATFVHYDVRLFKARWDERF